MSGVVGCKTEDEVKGKSIALQQWSFLCSVVLFLRDGLADVPDVPDARRRVATGAADVNNKVQNV
jgi:hypothetical protein